MFPAGEAQLAASWAGGSRPSLRQAGAGRARLPQPAFLPFVRYRSEADI